MCQAHIAGADSASQGDRQTRVARYPESFRGVGMSGRPKSCYYVDTKGSMRSPKGCEPHGDGGPIVVRGRESRPHGEAGQVVNGQQLRGTRDA
jgi:hypothetical protein